MDKKEFKQKVADYCSYYGYTWTFKELLEQWNKHKRHEYISFTANDVISKFKEQFELFY